MCECNKNSDVTEALERHAQRVFQVLGKYDIEEKDFDIELLRNAYAVFGEPFLEDLYNAVYQPNKRKDISNFTGAEESEIKSTFINVLSLPGQSQPSGPANINHTAPEGQVEITPQAPEIVETKKNGIWGIPTAAFVIIVVVLVMVLGLFIYKSK